MKLGEFLRICFGCHGRADRSFSFHGKLFPICARCTGELCGILFGIPLFFLFGIPDLPLTVILLIPLVLDGTIQQIGIWESNQIRRLLTGIWFGLGLISVMGHIAVMAHSHAVYVYTHWIFR